MERCQSTSQLPHDILFRSSISMRIVQTRLLHVHLHHALLAFYRSPSLLILCFLFFSQCSSWAGPLHYINIPRNASSFTYDASSCAQDPFLCALTAIQNYTRMLKYPQIINNFKPEPSMWVNQRKLKLCSTQVSQKSGQFKSSQVSSGHLRT